MNQTAVFDFKDILVNEIFGNIWLFAFGGIFILWLVAAKYRLPMNITLLLNIWFLSLIFAWDTGLVILWVLVLLSSAFLFYYTLVKGLIK